MSQTRSTCSFIWIVNEKSMKACCNLYPWYNCKTVWCKISRFNKSVWCSVDRLPLHHVECEVRGTWQNKSTYPFFHRFVFLVILGAEAITPYLKTIGFPSLNPKTHQLTTRWGSSSDDEGVDQGVCTRLQLHLMERGWTGKLARADCGLAGFDFCDLNREEELVIKLDIRQCRVKQFRWVLAGEEAAVY